MFDMYTRIEPISCCQSLQMLDWPAAALHMSDYLASSLDLELPYQMSFVPFAAVVAHLHCNKHVHNLSLFQASIKFICKCTNNYYQYGGCQAWSGQGFF